MIDAFADILDLPDQSRFQPLRETVFQSPFLAVSFVPFRLVGRNFRLVWWNFAKDQFADRENLQAMIANHADIKFPPLDVFLRDDIVIQFLMDKSDPLAELFVRLHKGCLRNSIRCLFLERFDENRKRQPFRTYDSFTPRNNDEIRRMDTVVAENFFRDALVLAKGQPGRTAAGERYARHREERNDVLIEGPVVAELVGQVENHI